MKTQFSFLPSRLPGAVSRRHFVTGSMAAAATLVLANSALGQTTASANRQGAIRLGLVGCGGRGSLIGSLFKEI